jgi:hypothetical protein
MIYDAGCWLLVKILFFVSGAREAKKALIKFAPNNTVLSIKLQLFTKIRVQICAVMMMSSSFK